MKALILAGGLGTRIGEETHDKPKPMITIGGIPLLEHIMAGLSWGGVQEFYIATGYKHEVIEAHFRHSKQFRVSCIFTGENSQTGGRIKKVFESISDERLLVTYGDGLSNIDARKLIEFHSEHGKRATVTAVRPPARFGRLTIIENTNVVSKFGEKIQSEEGWINGGFFILNRDVTQLIDHENSIFEQIPLTSLTLLGELVAFKHEGFWAPIDTMREKLEMERMWALGNAEWVPGDMKSS